MKNFRIILLAILSIVAGQSFATSTYYWKVNATATPTAAGKVYVTNSTATPTEEDYKETISIEGTGQNPTVHCYAQAEEGYKFVGWKLQNAENYVSTVADFDYTFTATSTSSSNRTTVNLEAVFASASDPLLNTKEGHTYLNVEETEENFVVENIESGLTFTSANEKVATVDEKGVVTAVACGTTTIEGVWGELKASYLITVLNPAVAGKTQIGNSDFEDWRNVTNNNHAPANWNSFETAAGSLAGMVGAQQVSMSEDVHEGSNGKYSVRIYSRSVVGVPAQGNLTCGRINAGSMTATAAGNHNFSNVESTAYSETIDKIPSAIKLWVKFVPAKENADYPYARIAATVHDKYNYITYGTKSSDNYDNQVHAIAQAEKNFEACEWTELTIPFEFTNTWGNFVEDTQKYIILNFSTNAQPGQGQANDQLFIDDIELLYDEEMIPPYITRYSNATVNIAGCNAEEALVAVNTEKSFEEEDYAETKNVNGANPETVSTYAPYKHTFYLSAKNLLTENENFKFKGWFDNAKAEGNAISTDLECTVEVEALSPIASQPTKKTFYAVFADETPTGVETIKVVKATSDVRYNMAGQRVNSNRGLTIINGKKVLNNR